MNRARGHFALNFAVVVAMFAAACGSSSSSPATRTSGSTSGSEAGSGSGSTGRGATSGSSSGSGTGSRTVPLPPPAGGGIACGPTLTCSAPLKFCCVTASGGGADAGHSGSRDSGTDGSASDGGIGGGRANAKDAGGQDAGDASGGLEASTRDGAGDNADASSDSGFGAASYRCVTNAEICAAGSTILACTNGDGCSQNEACCGAFGGPGFMAQCAPVPCTGGIQLCLVPADCPPDETCALYTSGALSTYGSCQPAEAGAGDASPANDAAPAGG